MGLPIACHTECNLSKRVVFKQVLGVVASIHNGLVVYGRTLVGCLQVIKSKAVDSLWRFHKLRRTWDPFLWNKARFIIVMNLAPNKKYFIKLL
jgi:hypothetical protein